MTIHRSKSELDPGTRRRFWSVIIALALAGLSWYLPWPGAVQYGMLLLGYFFATVGVILGVLFVWAHQTGADS